MEPGKRHALRAHIPEAATDWLMASRFRQSFRLARINFQTEIVNGELSGAKWYIVTQWHPVLLVICLQVLEVQAIGSYRVELAQNRWNLHEFWQRRHELNWAPTSEENTLLINICRVVCTIFSCQCQWFIERSRRTGDRGVQVSSIPA